MAPLLPGMEAPPHPMRLGDDEQAYYVDVRASPGGDTGRRARHATARRDRTGRQRECTVSGRTRPTAARVDGRRPVSALAAAAELSAGETVIFWILGPIALAGALGMVLGPQRHPLGALPGATMAALGVFYVVQEAPFLGAVQIIVYTGAIMILFLFVLMLVGRDSTDSVVETLRGQRVAATVLGVGFAGLVGGGIDRALDGHPGGRAGRRRNATAATSPAIAELLFTKYLFAFEVTSRAADHRRGRARWCWRTSSASPGEPAHPAGAVAGAVPLRPAAAAARPGRVRHRQLGRRARRCCRTARRRRGQHLPG